MSETFQRICNQRIGKRIATSDQQFTEKILLPRCKCEKTLLPTQCRTHQQSCVEISKTCTPHGKCESLTICKSNISTRWAPTSYKWSYNLYKWPYKWVTGVITLLMGVITPFITDRGPPCSNKILAIEIPFLHDIHA